MMARSRVELWGEVVAQAMVKLFIKQHAHVLLWMKHFEKQIQEMLLLADD